MAMERSPFDSLKWLVSPTAFIFASSSGFRVRGTALYCRYWPRSGYFFLANAQLTLGKVPLSALVLRQDGGPSSYESMNLCP